MIISKLGKDILIHGILDDKALHPSISIQLKIPEEVLRWDIETRHRYLEYLKKGKAPIYRARGMILGCAGAGKTTLLERLQKKSLEDIQKIKSTVGLDVHNDIFEVLEKEGELEVAVRKCEPAIHIKENVPVDDAEKIEEKKLLSILDFGGQCMYYACHQIYLSKRAFYILVVDMSKNLEDVIDEELCDQKDTMFSNWSHRDFLLFWLKSVHCYCGNEAPVILVATHAEGKSEQEMTGYYQELMTAFPGSSTIKTHLSSERYFSSSLKKPYGAYIESVDELERKIVEVITSQKHWGEEIPLDWALFEKFISEKKETKVQKLDKLKE
ncbi:probable serine/threonine-protein kinase roco5 [Saccostrea cucullata]|uniref:probable serine/threonine-protein kinase roco5 n=1 Tax=Saccostrea cuccullata TaxID=36930 RepID=UPI002ED5D02E